MRLSLACVCVLLPLLFAPQEPPKPAEEKPAAAAEPKPAEEKPAAVAEPKPAADAVKLTNPVKATPESLASGKKVYGTDCALCHGKDGSGNGDLAVDMKLKLADFRDLEALKGMTDGEIFTLITKGKGQMMGEEGRMKPNQVWDVVNYVRGFAKK